MPAQTNQAIVKTRDLGSGVVRNGKGYIIDGEEVKGIMLGWKRYKTRIEAMEREAGFLITKKGRRVPLNLGRYQKRNADEAELPVEENMEEQRESETDYESVEAEETKEQSPPKPKKKSVKRPRMK